MLFLLILLAPDKLYAFDISGLQPVAPYGVFSTFSAESLPANRYAFEFGLDRSREPNFNRISFRGAYGISDALEFNVTVPYIYSYENSTDGMEDISFGLKHRFYEEGKYGPSLAYILNVSVDNGRPEFSTDGRFGVGLVISKRVGPFKGNVNVFYEKPGTGRLKDEITFLGGVELAASHNLTFLGEFLARKSHFSNEYDQLETRFGYRLRTTESIFTTFGAGVALNNTSPEFRFLVSVSFLPAQGKKTIRRIIEEE